MNDLAQLAPFMFELQPCRITDKDGNPWFVASDVCNILGIIKSGRTFKDFPKDEKAWINILRSATQICGGYSISGTSDGY